MDVNVASHKLTRKVRCSLHGVDFVSGDTNQPASRPAGRAPDRCLLVWPDRCLLVWPDRCLLVWPGRYLLVWLDRCLLVWPGRCLLVCLDRCLLVWPDRCLLVWPDRCLLVWLDPCLLVWPVRSGFRAANFGPRIFFFSLSLCLFCFQFGKK